MVHYEDRFLVCISWPSLSLPALDNLVDKFWQVLYDSDKSLIHKEIEFSACFFSMPGRQNQGLSLPALDNPVDKFWQVLYDLGNRLIYKAIHRNAHFLGRMAAKR